MKKAFTLVELSIVLVIIGLLTAGVVGGQSLINSAKERKLITQLTGINTAVKAFQLEYDALPDDFNNAFAYWGTACAADAASCNGNGDKLVRSYQESTGFFKHLELAGILPGSYTMNSTATALVGGVNAGQTPYEKVVFTAREYYSGNCMTKSVVGLIEGGYAGGAGFANAWATIIKGKTMVSIDKKFDDGIGCSGKFSGNYLTGYSCPGAGDAIGTTYNLAGGDAGCGFLYLYN